MLWKIVLKIAKDLDFHGCIIMGDFGDFYCISSHAKVPYRSKGLKWEVEQINDLGLDALDAISFKEKIFIEGNHEDRLFRYLQHNAPELWGMTSTKEALYLDQRSWKFVPYRSHIKIQNHYFTHEIGKCGEMAHKQALGEFERSVSIGHTHHYGQWHKNDIDGTPRFGTHFGWLGDLREADYMHDAKKKKHWLNGLGIGYEIPKQKYFYAQPIPFIHQTAIVEGKLYGP